jgi:hypothetical protein
MRRHTYEGPEARYDPRFGHAVTSLVALPGRQDVRWPHAAWLHTAWLEAARPTVVVSAAKQGASPAASPLRRLGAVGGGPEGAFTAMVDGGDDACESGGRRGVVTTGQPAGSVMLSALPPSTWSSEYGTWYKHGIGMVTMTSMVSHRDVWYTV